MSFRTRPPKRHPTTSRWRREVAFSADGSQLVVAGVDGEVAALPIPFRIAEEGADVLESEALLRLQNAIDWGIYA